MAEAIDLERFKLPAPLHEEIFRGRIVPRELDSAVSQRYPVVVFVGGQPGAGKTAATDMIKHTMGLLGPAAHVCGDFYKPYHPDYNRLMATDDRTAGAYTRLDTRLWHADAEDWARARRCHTVVETALADAGEFAESAARFHAAGFRVEVAVLAVPEALSRLGIVARYLRQVEFHGHGRFVAQSNHDACYRGVPETVAAIHAQGLAGNIVVFRRGAGVVAAAHRDDRGVWNGTDLLTESVAAERRRPWTIDESLKFCANLNSIAQQAGPDWHAELRLIAELARPLATAGTPLDAAAQGQAGASFRDIAELSRARSASLLPGGGGLAGGPAPPAMYRRPASTARAQLVAMRRD
ncbi:zeta toxin family protein [Kribbella sp. NPDC055071]